MIFCKFHSYCSKINFLKSNSSNFLRIPTMSVHHSRVSSMLKLLTEKKLDSFIVDRVDPHNTEVPHSTFDRLSFISGFTGSYGLALVTHDKCYLWTDSRYFIQAERQLSSPWVLMKLLEKDVPSLTEFLSRTKEIKTVGFDLYSTTYKSHEHMVKKATEKEFVGLTENPVDVVWGKERPPLPLNPLKLHPLKYSGVSVSDKLVEVRKEMTKNNVNVLALTNLDEVAYMLNLRGSDVETSPLFYSYLVVEMDKIILFVDKRKLNDEVTSYLKSFSVETRDYNDVFSYLETVGTSEKGSPFKMWASTFSSVHLCNSFLKNHSDSTPRELFLETTPVCDLKACKNDTELKCMAEAHVADGIAMAKFFSTVYEMKDNGTLFDKDEYDLAKLSSKFRFEQENNVGLSFEPISSIAENGAVVHYRALKGDCSKIGPHMYLLDSGGQYLTGTTDVTRTVHFGTPTDEEKLAYTLVLKGHLALRHAKFPEGTPGESLDVLAKLPLWERGMNYYHGTGHGVGSYLNVHEGPCNITSLYKPKVGKPNIVYLKPGMVLSNEPGFYEAGKFGVRIENMFYVKELDDRFSKDNRKYYEFDDLTLVPYCKDLLDHSLLTKQEVEWINEYHKRISDTLVPRMSSRPGYEKAVEFLKKSAQPLLHNK
ncbi:Metallopeptidase family M24 family protein [Theileria parva strain Muguga]|uniref:Metallopeptidase family M24 family protein n=1 Tax=Theileria parva strain Muguga TaxID=333668 RepID=UPI001C622E91|nr:Metallopeptidase family M24 family protein [Theileria parva strain Muguga]EAN32091.2 Metallopeptidase family M24 family protein [Theileria parva strain Muguga]